MFNKTSAKRVPQHVNLGKELSINVNFFAWLSAILVIKLNVIDYHAP